jgi:hypothetical protein
MEVYQPFEAVREVVFMWDDKLHHLSGSDLAAYLRTPSSSSIELISYD